MTLVTEGLALDDPLRARVEEKVNHVTSRGQGRPIAARVAFIDENGPKGGAAIRCAVTIELPRRPPLHADSRADSRLPAFDAALDVVARELKAQRERRRDAARRPKKYFIARQALLPDGDAALPLPRRRRRTA